MLYWFHVDLVVLFSVTFHPCHPFPSKTCLWLLCCCCDVPLPCIPSASAVVPNFMLVLKILIRKVQRGLGEVLEDGADVLLKLLGQLRHVAAFLSIESVCEQIGHCVS